MNFKEHSGYEGSHAFLSPSKYHWLNYDDDKLAQTYLNFLAAQKGTELHKFAEMAISNRIKLQRSKKTLNAYINDAIGFMMSPEKVLWYSSNCYGTADAIGFDGHLLRIHDLKTGVVPAHMEQLLIYAALFCLEYHQDPNDIETELRIYQNDGIDAYAPEPDELSAVMEKIIHSDKVISNLREEREDGL